MSLQLQENTILILQWQLPLGKPESSPKNVNFHKYTNANLHLLYLDMFVFAAMDMDGGSAEGTVRGGVLRLGGLCTRTDQTVSAAASRHTGSHAKCY